MPTRRGLPHDLLVTAFPFHMAFDRDMRVVQTGRVLQRLYPDLSLRKPLQHDFRINRPPIKVDFEAIREHSQSLFILESLHNGMLLKGQMLPTESPEGIFMHSPFWS